MKGGSVWALLVLVSVQVAQSIHYNSICIPANCQAPGQACVDPGYPKDVVCATLLGLNAPCVTDSQCASQTCYQGTCHCSPCTLVTDIFQPHASSCGGCPAGQQCSTAFTCFTPTPPGMPCKRSAECLLRSCVKGTCGCYPPCSLYNGPSQAPAPSCGACPSGQQCSASRTCAPPGQLGAPCKAHSDCAFNMCVQGVCRCQPCTLVDDRFAPPAASCGGCSAGLHCLANHTCAKPLAVGQACTSGFQCATGICYQNVCQCDGNAYALAFGAEFATFCGEYGYFQSGCGGCPGGQGCNDPGDTAPSSCKLAAAQACVYDSDCASDYCANGNCFPFIF